MPKVKPFKLPKRFKTAYDMLGHIAKLGLAEPKRMAMGEVLVRRGSAYPPDLGYPKCGTVGGCIATGWTHVLSPSPPRCFIFFHRRQATLGLSTHQRGELFCNEVLCNQSRQQTPAHARAVARHIAKFQKKYAAQLKATKLPKQEL